MNRSDRPMATHTHLWWPSGARRGLALLAATVCLLQCTACNRITVVIPTAEHLPSAGAAVEDRPTTPALQPAHDATAAPPPGVPPQQLPPRPLAYLTTATPLPRPTATPSPTIAPPPPAIPLAEAPPSELAIPAIGLRATVVPMGWREEADGSVLWEDPGTAVGWLERSALPGEGTNVVLAGHHNIRGEVFRYLVDVAPGDEVYLAAGETTYRYLVRERFIVPEKHVSEEQRAQNALWIAPTIDERLTLVTCWPYRDNSHRLIVIAAPAPLEEAS
ncbi:MAG TPA: sortase [Chloroflexi bacterium]|nr:sortase [Chloroflexota bacterium]